jgi:hypothetical protein
MNAREHEISTGSRRRIVGWISYILFFAAVAGALALVFAQFTGSKLLAITLVLGMVAYMIVMGYLTSRRQ